MKAQHHETESNCEAQPIPRFRSAYGVRYRVSLNCPEQPHGRTKQSHKDECDINTIMARYIKTGLIDFVNQHQPQYGDVTGIEYQSAMDIIATGNTMFEELPAEWRKRFGNDPAVFLDFVQNPANRAEAIELGIINPDRPTAKEATPVATPPTAPNTGDSAPAGGA